MTYPGMSFQTAYEVYPPPTCVRRPIEPFSGRWSSNGTMTAVNVSRETVMSLRSAGRVPGYNMTVSPFPAQPLRRTNKTMLNREHVDRIKANLLVRILDEEAKISSSHWTILESPDI